MGGIHLSAPADGTSEASASRHGRSSAGRSRVPGSDFEPMRPEAGTAFDFESMTSDR
jgi:hypothetical protein